MPSTTQLHVFGDVASVYSPLLAHRRDDIVEVVGAEGSLLLLTKAGKGERLKDSKRCPPLDTDWLFFLMMSEENDTSIWVKIF